MSLVPCSKCQRHIRVDHETCPFCQTEVPTGFAGGIIPGAKKRLDRLALFTFATAFAAACSSGGLVDGDGDAGASTDGSTRDGTANDDGGVQAIYGAPVDAGPPDMGNPVPPYGLPPPPEDAGNPVPAYGAPFDSGTD